MDASHWIGSISFELRSSDGKALDPVRRALREDHDRILIRPLQRALDRADRAGRVARRRRIEVDLGLVTPVDFGELLERRIAEAMHVEVERDLWAQCPDQLGGTEGEQLLSFLENAHLAWPSPGKALEAICMALARNEEESLVWLTDHLRRLFSRLPTAAERFVRQCPLMLVIRIAAILDGGTRMPTPAPAERRTYAGEAEARRLAALILKLVRGETVSDRERQWFETLIALGVGAGNRGTAEELPVVQRASPAPDGPHATEPPAARPKPRANRADPAAEDVAVREALPLEAAGTVLIHPFLSQLFSATGYLDQARKFIGGEARSRAALLLHFAATGEREVAEPELALAKLLCGLELSALVPRSIEPTKLEEAEVDALLRAAISHWSALGNTSPEALRETFLRRPGRLQQEGEDWRLTVEQRGVDILVDRLPWTIGLVMTPFMAHPLRVEWR